MPTLWDTAKERKLLLAIIELTNPKPPSWQDVSVNMGGDFSSEACRQVPLDSFHWVATIYPFSPCLLQTFSFLSVVTFPEMNLPTPTS